MSEAPVTRMFRITKKADYAVFILSYLARRAAEEGRDALVSAQELASFSALNKSLVANLLKDLTRAGFLGSVRGARGGYRLAASPREISLGAILRAVEGPFSFVECAHEREFGNRPDCSSEGDAAGDDTIGVHEACNLAGLCQSKGPLLVLNARIQKLLNDLKLVELAGLETSQGEPIPSEFFPSRSDLSGVGAPAPSRQPSGSPATPDERVN
jgi:Rrf2 family protein